MSPRPSWKEMATSTLAIGEKPVPFGKKSRMRPFVFSSILRRNGAVSLRAYSVSPVVLEPSLQPA